MTDVVQFSDVPPAIEQVWVPDTCLGCTCEAYYVTLVGWGRHTCGLIMPLMWTYDATPLG
jgi:hypothetical protein